jgi:flagellar basal body-associated protein FliL
MQDEGLTAESHEPSASGGRGRWRSITAVVGVLAVAAGVAAFLFLSSDPDAPIDRAAPARGLACPDLRAAAEAYERGDDAAFDRAIAQAAEVAEQTLQTSGQVFGEPESIALELELAGGGSGESVRTERLLERALQDCRDMEST